MGALTASQAVQWMRNHNPVSAAPQWQRTHPLRMYALGLGEPWIKPLRRFVIVTPGRSGSELLVDLLDSHPDIVCDPEILAERWALPARFVAGRAVRAALFGARAYGFKLYCGHFGYQVIRDHPQYLQELSETGVQVIFLRRENTLAQAISAAMAMKSRWHYRRQDDAHFTPLALDPVEVLVLAYLFDENDQYLEAALARLPHLRLTYEDDLADPVAQQATANRISSELGVSSAPASSDFVRLSPRRLEDAVANFPEIADLIRHTRFGRHLEM